MDKEQWNSKIRDVYDDLEWGTVRTVIRKHTQKDS